MPAKSSRAKISIKKEAAIKSEINSTTPTPKKRTARVKKVKEEPVDTNGDRDELSVLPVSADSAKKEIARKVTAIAKKSRGRKVAKGDVFGDTTLPDVEAVLAHPEASSGLSSPPSNSSVKVEPHETDALNSTYEPAT